MPAETGKNPERALLRLLLVRACEERDPQGGFLPASERERATREARKRVPLGASPSRREVQAFVGHRSERLWEWLSPRFPTFRFALAAARMKPALPLVLLVGLAAGFLLDELGNARRINLLSFPLLGLLLWNAAVYVGLAGAAVRRWTVRSAPGEGGLGERLTGGLRSLIRRIASAGWLRSADRSPEELRWMSAAVERFFVLWRERFGAIEHVRARCLLHAGAAAVAVGIVAGMYVRGFAFEYRATWESTFLEAPAVHGLLSWLLAPAAAVLGVELPGPDGIAALRAPSDGPAALWIHLWGVTTLLGVALPRAILGIAGALRGRMLARALFPDEKDPYVRRLLLQGRVERSVVEICPYSHAPSERTVAAIRALGLDLFGNRTQVLPAEPVSYGEDFTPEDHDGRHRIVLFNIAQTPEQEVHGEFLEAAKQAARDGGAFLLACVDAEPYRQIADPERVEERIRTWRRLVREADLELVVVGGEGASDETFASMITAAGGALWPAAPETVT